MLSKLKAIWHSYLHWAQSGYCKKCLRKSSGQKSILIPLFSHKLRECFDSNDVLEKAFEILKGMHEPIGPGDWVLQLYGDIWKKERAKCNLSSSYHPCQIYIYKSNRETI